MEKRQKFVIVSRKSYSGNECVKIVTRNFEIMQDCTYISNLLTYLLHGAESFLRS